MSVRMPFKPIFPYSITSILSKVRHSNTLFLTISFAFPCRPLGVLVRFPCVCVGGGGGAQQLQCKSESAQCSEKQQSPCEGLRGVPISLRVHFKPF